MFSDHLTDTTQECMTNEHQKQLILISDIRSTFKQDVVEFTELQQRAKELIEKKQTYTDMLSSLKKNVRSLHRRLTQPQQEALDNVCTQAMTAVDIYVYSAISQIESEIDVVKQNLSVLKTKLKSGIELFKCMSMVNGKFVCAICINSSVEVFCNPCGHTYCNACVRNTKLCYLCRTPVDKVCNLYFT